MGSHDDQRRFREFDTHGLQTIRTGWTGIKNDKWISKHTLQQKREILNEQELFRATKIELAVDIHDRLQYIDR